MNDYNKYITFLNNNLSKKIINLRVNKKNLAIFYQDIIESKLQYKELVKSKNYSVNIINNNNFSVDSYYFPKEYKKYIKQLTKKVEFIFHINGKSIILIFYYLHENMNFLYNCFKQCYIWLNIVNKYGTKKCSNTLKVKIYFLDLKKQLPINKGEIIDVINANSAFSNICQPNGEIVIYRKEEWFKVFIHETFHAFGLDFNFIENKKIKDDLLNIINIDSTMYMFETYTETWATIWHICFNCFHISENLNQNLFNNYFNYFLALEQVHSIYQSIKILEFMNLKYQNLISKTKTSLLKKKLYKEKTNIFNYYILKAVCLVNIDSFLEFCHINNNFLNFDSSEKNINMFTSILKKNLFSLKSTQAFKQGELIYLKGIKENNYFTNYSLRMTICEI